MFSRANCTASSRLIASTAPFEAVYEICDVAAPRIATKDATLITEPPPRSRRYGMPCLQQRKTPFVFTFLDPLPRLDRRVEHGGVVVGRDAGVVVEDVDAAEPVGGRAHHRRDLLLVGDVDLERERSSLGAERDRLLGAGELHVGGADLGALLREDHRSLASHPAAGAGDHGDLAVEPAHQASVATNTFLTSE